MPKWNVDLDFGLIQETMYEINASEPARNVT